MNDKMTYATAGVDYESMDPFKREALKEALKTAPQLLKHGWRDVESSRGESVKLIERDGLTLAHVNEGLGTKNLVADAMYALKGVSYYDCIGQDAVAMIVNDMITLGAQPLEANMHIDVGSSDWFNDTTRCADLLRGWRRGLEMAACSWGGGESATLTDIINADTFSLSGSAIGVIPGAVKRIDPQNLRAGDAIVFLASSGIHANGLSMARKIAKKLPGGYLERVGNDSFGAALLQPTIIYQEAIASLMSSGVDIHYAVNITGHGWRKLMRAPQPLGYVIEHIPPIPPVFEFMMRNGPIDLRTAFETFNMGVGFAIMMPRGQVNLAIAALQRCTIAYKACYAGDVRASEKKFVRIETLDYNMEFDSLAIR